MQNPAAQSEFKERTLLRPRTRGQIKLVLEHLGDCPVARGRRVYRVEQPWQLYSSLGPRRRAGPVWIAESGTFFAGFWFVGGVGSGFLGFGLIGVANSRYLELVGVSQEGHSWTSSRGS